MKCWHCNAELIWGGDHDIEEGEMYDIVTNLHCPECHCMVPIISSNRRNNKGV